MRAESFENYNTKSRLGDGNITTLPIARGFVTLASATDIFSIMTSSSMLVTTLNPSFCVDTYTEAVRLTGPPQAINTDQRAHLPFDAFVPAVTASGAKLLMDGARGLDRQPFHQAVLTVI